MARALGAMRISWLDVRLGLRMLAKYPGLSLVSVTGMSVAIAIGAVAFGVISTIMDPTVPLDEGDRLVSIRNWDTRSSSPDLRALHDFAAWKSELQSVSELGAFRSESRTLRVDDGTRHLVEVAEITASGFAIARVAPVMGRPLITEDEREASPHVVIISEDEWQRRFGRDPHILGRPLRLGSTTHIVVGVMPESFRFPINHRYWIPLRVDPARYEPGNGPAISVFGRLADGAAIENAQSELSAIAARMAAQFPETHEHLRARATPYTYPFLGIDNPATAMLLRSAIVVISMLLALVAVNVAILVYARTATRSGEIAIRTALGASRRRIATQLFVEALVLSLIAAVVGLTGAGIVLAEILDIMQPGQAASFPFWIEFGLSAELVAYVAVLAVTSAFIVGVLPALKATGRRVQSSLQRLSSGGSGLHLGRMWTALIIAQVAVAVAVLPFAGYLASQSVRRAGAEAGYAADEILRARLTMEADEVPAGVDPEAHLRASAARFSERADQLVRRLEAEPMVGGVTFTSTLAGYPFQRVEGDAGKTVWAFVNRVDTDHFAVLGVPVTGGREFLDADVRAGGNQVIVNRVLAEEVFGGGNVLGRRIRYVARNPGTEAGTAPAGPWLEIVGVVPDFAIQGDLEPPHARLYEPIALSAITPNTALNVRIRGAVATTFAQRFREVVAEVDPALQLHDLRTAADAERMSRRSLALLSVVTAAVVLSVMLLSAAGIYAMMSFTIVRRRREIGIRSALGADPRRLLRDIFARASAQLLAGVAVGLVLAAFVGGPLGTGSGPLEANGLVMLPAVATLMVIVGLLAALSPARKGLSIQPTEALREE